MLKKFTIKTKLIALIVLGAIPVILLALISIINFNMIEDEWESYVEVVYQKEEHLTNILSLMGYGGYIHSFKNYVLRNEEKFFDVSEEKYNQLVSEFDSYELVGQLSETEKKSLEMLREMVEVYHNQLLKTQSLIKEGKTPIEIDNIVKVTDKPYLEALDKLKAEIKGVTNNKKNEISKLVIILNIVVVLFLIGSLLDFLFLTLWIGRNLLKSIKSFIDTYEKGMNGDLTVRMEVNDSKDEFNTMAKHYNSFMELLNKIMNELKNSIEGTKDISFKLQQSSEKSSSALMQIKSNISGMRSKVETLDNEINSANNSAIEVQSFISNVVDLISSQASAINQSSASVEEMSASIQNIAKVTEEKLSITNELEQTASSGENEMKNTMEIIYQVANSANVILEMMNVINNIAGQTNLLAMNASIEAAHAGDTGRGFAVVADEIRTLAEDTTQNAKDISKSLKKIVKDIHTSEESTNKTSSFFTSIVFGIKNVSNSMIEMKNTTQELALGSSDVIKSLGSLVDMTERVKSSSKEGNEKVSTITNSFSNINIISTDVRNGMEEVEVGTTELFNTTALVAEEGQNNMDSVIELEKLVNQFKLVDSKDNDDNTFGDIPVKALPN